MSSSSAVAATQGGPGSSGAAPKESGQFHCDYCRRDISSVVHIRCAECDDFDLCLDCFSSGVEVFPHRNDHPYRVVEHVTTPIFDEEWGADEELLLLEAIQMYGLGNWSDVADHVGNGKKKDKCEQHYVDVYLSGSTAPLPDPSRELVTKKRRVELDAAASKAKSEEEAALEAASAKLNKKKGGLGALVGYIPHRGDFDVEYDNEAEMVLADMEFKPGDTAAERKLKLCILDIYNARLDARIQRKAFVLERGLLEPAPARMTQLEREVDESMRPFARFQSADDHKRFVAGIVHERRLRSRIAQLQTWRLNGVRTLAEAERFEAARKKRDVSGGSGNGPDTDAPEDRTDPAAFVAAPLTGGGMVPGAADEVRAGKKRSAGAAGIGAVAGAGGGNYGMSSSSSSSNNNMNSSNNGPAGSAGGGLQQGATANKRAKLTVPSGLDVSEMELADLLSENEQRLCSELRLIPRHYVMIKEQLLRESLQRGFLSPNSATQLVKIDAHRSEKIVEFFVSRGWVSSASVAAAAAAAGLPPAPAHV